MKGIFQNKHSWNKDTVLIVRGAAQYELLHDRKLVRADDDENGDGLCRKIVLLFCLTQESLQRSFTPLLWNNKPVSDEVFRVIQEEIYSWPLGEVWLYRHKIDHSGQLVAVDEPKVKATTYGEVFNVIGPDYPDSSILELIPMPAYDEKLRLAWSYGR